MLSKDRLKELFNYNPETGLFTRTISASHAKKGSIAGTKFRGYLCISVDGKEYMAHRLAWLYMTGKFPENHIDHINTNKADNRFCNLRDATLKVNNQNIRKATIRNKCGILGVSTRYGKYTAAIKSNDVSIYLGTFNTAEEAHKKYIETKRVLHEGCTL